MAQASSNTVGPAFDFAAQKRQQDAQNAAITAQHPEWTTNSTAANGPANPQAPQQTDYSEWAANMAKIDPLARQQADQSAFDVANPSPQPSSNLASQAFGGLQTAARDPVVGQKPAPETTPPPVAGLQPQVQPGWTNVGASQINPQLGQRLVPNAVKGLQDAMAY